MAKYAEKTQVPIGRSKAQIEGELVRYGVQEYAFGNSPRGSGIIFKHQSKTYKINVNSPNRDEFATQKKFEQAERSRWRLLLICIKAKLNLVQSGQSKFEDEFLAHMILPDGNTVGDFMRLPENVLLLEKMEIPRLLTG
jgi:hypothetical protein